MAAEATIEPGSTTSSRPDYARAGVASGAASSAKHNVPDNEEGREPVSEY